MQLKDDKNDIILTNIIKIYSIKICFHVIIVIIENYQRNSPFSNPNWCDNYEIGPALDHSYPIMIPSKVFPSPAISKR